MAVAYDGLRGWMAAMRDMGQLIEVRGASWQEDIGMIAELVNKREDTPAIVCDGIPGYPEGYRVLINAVANPGQIAFTYGLPMDLSKMDLSRAVCNVSRQAQPLPPVEVASGPALENVLEGQAVDLLRFPTPVWHEGDNNNRYINTGGCVITRDADDGWVNLGTYRVMVHDSKTLGLYISPGKHGRMHLEKYLSRGEPCPIAVVPGPDPLLFIAACSEIPFGMTEYDWAGGVRGKPYSVFRGRATGLPLPADAEIVLEGFVYPGETRTEGPFGEWTGYYGSQSRNEPVIRVQTVYHRHQPIMFGYPPQQPPDAMQRIRSIQRSALLQEEIGKAGVPDVTGAWAFEVGGARLLLAVAIRQRYPGHARQAGHIASQCHVGAYAGRYVVVVDDDIDPSNLEEVVWAMLTRSDPATSIDIIQRAWSTPLDPRIPPEDRAAKRFMNSRAIIDATRPFEWRDQFPPVNAPSPERRRRTLERWGYLLQSGRPAAPPAREPEKTPV